MFKRTCHGSQAYIKGQLFRIPELKGKCRCWLFAYGYTELKFLKRLIFL